jgi:hypothetical protein
MSEGGEAMETREALMEALAEVEKWENEQKDLWFWEKAARLPFVLLDKLTPAFIQEKLAQAIDEMASYVQTGGQYLIREQDVLQRFREYPNNDSSLLTIDQAASLPLTSMDAVADELSASYKKIGTIQGATTGIGGVFTLAIDIPLLLGLSLKVLQEMAIAYGYNPREKGERVFIVKCLQFASSDIVGKRAIIEELAYFHSKEKKIQTISQLQGWREVVFTYRDNYGWKKLFQLVPVAGMLFGAYLNRKTLEEVAEAGKMMFRKRRILERLST